jgi:hypothetical protein
MLSELVIVASVPFTTVTWAELVKDATASEKTSVTVALSPAFSDVSERVKKLTEGAVVSTVKELIFNVTELLAVSVTVTVQSE